MPRVKQIMILMNGLGSGMLYYKNIWPQPLNIDTFEILALNYPFLVGYSA